MLFLFLASWSASAASSAFDNGFPVQNEAALAQSFALPALGAPRLVAPGQTQYRASLDWTNAYVLADSGAEQLIEDGESQRVTIDLRHGFDAADSGRFELGLTLPVIARNGGILDGIIQNYHHLFGFPDGGRNLRPHGRIRYRYTRNGQVIFDLDHGSVGLGDVELSAGWQLRPALALRAMLKLPTGQHHDLDGGNTGGAVWLDYAPPIDPGSRWFGFVSGGVSFNATSDVLPQYQRHTLLLGELGLGFHITPAFALLAQFYAHSPLYKHTMESALRKVGLQGTFGGRYAFSRHLAIDAGFQEDLVTDSSPDFSIHLGVVLR